jgi:hypothetical protein
METLHPFPIGDKKVPDSIVTVYINLIIETTLCSVVNANGAYYSNKMPTSQGQIQIRYVVTFKGFQEKLNYCLPIGSIL